ncbi:BnaCnng08800D [Brassica napus]|uniref:(rape) hypothetical protein n=1 Tax=Brassica napus TaxID=3708 RepID=A0A078HL53_BRANA|nr:unnamed protein product [Brassica napus]CDY38019.1 BnaCnng08800D [Brassica napus]
MANSLLLKQALDLFSPVHGQFPPLDAEALEQPLLPLAPSAIKATKPLKKGKREPEDDLDTKVNLTSTAEERLGPILKLFDAVGEGKPSPLLHCFYDGTWSTVKRSFTVVHDFKDVCFHSYFSLMDEIRKCPDQNYHEIRYMNKLILSVPFPHRNQELLGAKRVFFFFAHVEARVTVLTCQWLMGPCKVNTIDLPNGEAWENGVLVEKCQYLEESKCVGVCINTVNYQLRFSSAIQPNQFLLLCLKQCHEFGIFDQLLKL